MSIYGSTVVACAGFVAFSASATAASRACEEFEHVWPLPADFGEDGRATLRGVKGKLFGPEIIFYANDDCVCATRLPGSFHTDFPGTARDAKVTCEASAIYRASLPK